MVGQERDGPCAALARVGERPRARVPRNASKTDRAVLMFLRLLNSSLIILGSAALQPARGHQIILGEWQCRDGESVIVCVSRSMAPDRLTMLSPSS